MSTAPRAQIALDKGRQLGEDVGMTIWSNRSFLSIWRSMARRSVVHWVMGCARRGARKASIASYSPLTTPRALPPRPAPREWSQPVSVVRSSASWARPAAVKRNGGLRGSKATRWAR